MVVPIFNSMLRIDKSLLEAAYDTGASTWQMLTNVIIPLSRPGIIIGSIFVVTIVMGDFLTILEVSVPVIKQNIEAQGFGNLCKDVIASGIPVLELENNPNGAINTLSECIKNIEVQDPKIAVVLGCAGMTNVCERLQAQHNLYLLDPIVSSARMVNAIL